MTVVSMKRVAAAAAMALMPWVAMAQFAVSPLPYAPEALEPYVDKMTMEIHHGKHHAAYVNNLNNLAKETPALATMSVESINKNIASYGVAVRNNAGGHYNHELFWKVMAPEAQRGQPSDALKQALMKSFGSMEEFQSQFNKAALARFGSGWAWLIVKNDKTLAITSTANQDNPLMNLPEITQGTPVLGLDVWEHAYYLKYQNRRAEYATNWWKVVNWNEVNKRFDAAMK